MPLLTLCKPTNAVSTAEPVVLVDLDKDPEDIGWAQMTEMTPDPVWAGSRATLRVTPTKKMFIETTWLQGCVSTKRPAKDRNGLYAYVEDESTLAKSRMTYTKLDPLGVESLRALTPRFYERVNSIRDALIKFMAPLDGMTPICWRIGGEILHQLPVIQGIRQDYQGGKVIPGTCIVSGCNCKVLQSGNTILGPGMTYWGANLNSAGDYRESWGFEGVSATGLCPQHYAEALAEANASTKMADLWKRKIWAFITPLNTGEDVEDETLTFIAQILDLKPGTADDFQKMLSGINVRAKRAPKCVTSNDVMVGIGVTSNVALKVQSVQFGHSGTICKNISDFFDFYNVRSDRRLTFKEIMRGAIAVDDRDLTPREIQTWISRALFGTPTTPYEVVCHMARLLRDIALKEEHLEGPKLRLRIVEDFMSKNSPDYQDSISFKIGRILGVLSASGVPGYTKLEEITRQLLPTVNSNPRQALGVALLKANQAVLSHQINISRCREVDRMVAGLGVVPKHIKADQDVTVLGFSAGRSECFDKSETDKNNEAINEELDHLTDL